MNFFNNSKKLINNTKTKIISAAIMAGISMSTVLPVFADDAKAAQVTTAAENAIYTNIVWPFVYFMCGLVVLLGMGTFAVCFARLASSSSSPQMKHTIYVTLYRNFWIMAVAGSIGSIFGLIISVLQ